MNVHIMSINLLKLHAKLHTYFMDTLSEECIYGFYQILKARAITQNVEGSLG